MFVFILMIAGAVVSLLVPYGTVIVIGVILGLVVDNYRNTLYIREDIRSIKKHLGLMNNKEAEEYEFEKQWSQQEQLTSDEIRVINKRIEVELEKENRNKKN
ncbi:hypothetical protein [Paenibacillus illinoisensis]|uniref:hypothetical protein n=1 Tax=Paenibacillus illinoisensis TaxID=59845 RepID=UPI003D97A2A0